MRKLRCPGRARWRRWSRLRDAAAPPDRSARRLLAHIKFLASDELQGRGNGSAGLERAGDYIAEQFKAAGLRPGGPNGDWFQPFELHGGSGGRRRAMRSSIDARGRNRSACRSGPSYYPLAGDAERVAGGAIDGSDDRAARLRRIRHLARRRSNYDDYAGLDVTGKAVLIFSHEPQENRRDSRLNGTRPMRETTLVCQGARRAQPRCAGPARRLRSVASRRPGELRALRHRGPTPRTTRSRSFAIAARRAGAAAPGAGSSTGVAAAIDRDLMPRSRALAGADDRLHGAPLANRRTVRNVVGILPGSDPAKAGEAIVLGAHYDHVGLGGRFSATRSRTGEIHNGADDNASGTAAIIEIARAAAADRARFPRSLVFVAFAGEERGLLGSAHYANNPAVPLSTPSRCSISTWSAARNGKVDVSGLRRRRRSRPICRRPRRPPAASTSRREGPGAGPQRRLHLHSTGASRRSSSSPASTTTTTARATTGTRSTPPARRAWRRSRWSSPRASRRAPIGLRSWIEYGRLKPAPTTVQRRLNLRT